MRQYFTPNFYAHAIIQTEYSCYLLDRDKLYSKYYDVEVVRSASNTGILANKTIGKIKVCKK